MFIAPKITLFKRKRSILGGGLNNNIDLVAGGFQ